MTSLQAEIDLLRGETVAMQQEADRRALLASEMEEQQQIEHTSLRKTISVLEQQLEREKQVGYSHRITHR